MKNLIILTGPTGIGKTEISLKLAEKFGCEIISCDSMQIYKDLDIGTAKISLDETNILHHMVDIVTPDENFSVAEFQDMTKKLITDINNRGKVPMLVGGTGLYINSIVYNLEFANTSQDFEYRNKLMDMAKDEDQDFLHNKLKKLNPKEAEKIHPNNHQRIIRALEISKNGEIKGSKFREENNDYNLIYMALNMDRQKLYERINERVIKMIDMGLVDEAKYAIDKYNLTRDSQSMKAIGYKEIFDYLDDNYTLDEMIEEIQKNSRHYAKRQLTWFRRDSRIKWFEREDEKLIEEMEDYIGERLERI
ncbi:tRNA (adenosine(37)-N6)-dimethylallyltransferase MiaA [Peptoniphilus sp.]|jgi:tRNA dimethylallyltransferase|uniref:tRNA (adenosine(37)-N6)-dimethylallyltransferase MiaA n=1 Tax=Peptoniphilus sp. TaxID=1971214 RepID=UPI003D8E3B8A